MMKVTVNRFACSILLALFCVCSHAAIAQQAKPVAAKASSSKTDPSCAKKGKSCCKGTPTRAAVLAANTSKKTVKK